MTLAIPRFMDFKVDRNMIKLKPRLYQETILATCVANNSLVVLPTGMGKTMVAMMLAAQRLQSHPNSKVLFLVPTKPLAEQHLRSFKGGMNISVVLGNEGDSSDFIESSADDKKSMVLFTGNVKPEKRAEMWKEAKIIFSTPQGLENDIITNRIDLSEVSLVVFDEAHRATGDYAYTFIAKQYDRKAQFPKILALTASPGSDLAKIQEVMDNLFIEAVEVRTDNDPDVKPYVQKTKIDWLEVGFPKMFQDVHKFLKACYNSKLSAVQANGYGKNLLNNGKTQLLKLQGALHAEMSKGFRSFELLKSVSLLAEAMKVEHAVELLETQGIESLMTYFRKIYSDAQISKTKAVKNLANDINFKSASILARRLSESGIEHPKLIELKNLVRAEFEKKKDVKIILFNQFRDNAKKVRDVIDGISGVSARLFVGQAKKNGTGMSQKEQKEMLQSFRDGEFNCLVATSVAEEGIDIPSVDLVIFYEPVPSGIRTIQRRGRTGRQDKGRVVVLLTKGTREEAYRWSAHHKEKRMYRELETLRVKNRIPKPRAQRTVSSYSSSSGSGGKKDGVESQEIVVFTDMREKAGGVVKDLIDLGVSVKMKTMEVGDYQLSRKVCVEYKKVPDFVDSIVDGRLLDQIKNLKNAYERPLVIVEGDGDIYSQRNIHPNAIRGMFSTIAVSYGVPVMQTKTPVETAALMHVIARREQNTDRGEFNPHASRKPMSTKELQEYIVSALPGVGPVLAKPLLEKFGSVRKVLSAEVEELQEVARLGEKKADEIQRVLDEEYVKKL